MKFVEMTTKDLEYYISLIHKAAAGFERLDSSFESSTVNKCYQTTLRATKKSFMKGKVSLSQQTSLL